MDEKTIDRFWSHVTKTETCWLWTSTLRAGYGMFSFKGKPVSAHRFSYSLANGEIPDGLLVRHSNDCVSRACVRPDHLKVGTQTDNMADRMDKGWFNDKEVYGPYRPKGPRGRKRKLTLEQISEIMEALKNPYWGQVNHLAEKYGTTHSTISNLKHGHWFPAHITPEEL